MPRSNSERLLHELDADLHRRVLIAEALDVEFPGTLARFEQAVREDREARRKEVERTGRPLPPRPLGPANPEVCKP